MKKFALGFVAGTVCGGVIIWALSVRKATTSTAPDESPSSLSQAASWVFPREATIADIFIDPEQLETLRTPETISLHQVGTHGIRIGGYTFEQNGALLSGETLKAAANCFRSMNSYTPPKACGFEPGMLVRFSKSKHHLDIMVCFRCDDIAWRYDNAEPEAISMMGLSRIGSDMLWMIAREVWPNAEVFKVRPKQGP